MTLPRPPSQLGRGIPVPIPHPSRHLQCLDSELGASSWTPMVSKVEPPPSESLVTGLKLTAHFLQFRDDSLSRSSVMNNALVSVTVVNLFLTTCALHIN